MEDSRLGDSFSFGWDQGWPFWGVVWQLQFWILMEPYQTEAICLWCLWELEKGDQCFRRVVICGTGSSFHVFCAVSLRMLCTSFWCWWKLNWTRGAATFGTTVGTWGEWVLSRFCLASLIFSVKNSQKECGSWAAGMLVGRGLTFLFTKQRVCNREQLFASLAFCYLCVEVIGFSF